MAYIQYQKYLHVVFIKLFFSLYVFIQNVLNNQTTKYKTSHLHKTSSFATELEIPPPHLYASSYLESDLFLYAILMQNMYVKVVQGNGVWLFVCQCQLLWVCADKVLEMIQHRQKSFIVPFV